MCLLQISNGSQLVPLRLGGVFGSMCAVACMTLTQNNYRLTFTLAAIPSTFAIFMLLYFVRKPNRLQTKHYGMPKYPAQKVPSKRRYGRGPLAMVGLALFTTLLCIQNTVRLMTASVVYVTNLTPGSASPTRWCTSPCGGGARSARTRVGTWRGIGESARGAG
jgi:hypothetical protein